MESRAADARHHRDLELDRFRGRRRGVHRLRLCASTRNQRARRRRRPTPNGCSSARRRARRRMRAASPSSGQAGRLLDNMLAALGLQRSKRVYIANVLKCRPPDNRAPEPAEAEACRPYLDRQIELIRPKLIVALGKSAATPLLRFRRDRSRVCAGACIATGACRCRHLPSGVSASQLARQSEGVGRSAASRGRRCAACRRSRTRSGGPIDLRQAAARRASPCTLHLRRDIDHAQASWVSPRD